MAKRKNGGKKKGGTAKTAKVQGPPRPRTDRGTLNTRLHHARAFLGIADRTRLELLVNVPIQNIYAAGQIELPKGKRPMTEAEEWEAVRRAVTEERERLFAKAERAPHAAQRKDPIGRAWYEGLLEGQGVDSSVLRELGREYGALYWAELEPLAVAQCGYADRVGRPNVKRKFHMAGLNGADAARFEMFERIIAPLGREVRNSLQKLCVDDIWWLTGPEWLDRCINSRRRERISRGERCEQPSGESARGFDMDTLTQAITGLRALAVGVSR